MTVSFTTPLSLHVKPSPLLEHNPPQLLVQGKEISFPSILIKLLLVYFLGVHPEHHSSVHILSTPYLHFFQVCRAICDQLIFLSLLQIFNSFSAAVVSKVSTEGECVFLTLAALSFFISALSYPHIFEMIALH